MSDLPQPADRRQLRVSDADREQAAEVLRQAAGDGRITFDELDQRLEAAYGARTYGDLTEVTADLPAGTTLVAASPSSRLRRQFWCSARQSPVESEAHGAPLSQIFIICNQRTRAVVESPVEKVRLSGLASCSVAELRRLWCCVKRKSVL